MEKSIAKLDNFIKDVISYSRNTRLELLHEEVNLTEMIEGAFLSMNYLEGCQDIERETDLGEGIIHSDPRRLEVILNNLISNAIRYRDPAKNPSRIRIASREDADMYVIEVEDNGIGIEPQFQERIFEMFFRATKKSQGSGIGLYIVREAVQKLGGKISVQSVLGQGTLFRIELPRHI
jgi:signal transduction histidine kinase